MAKRSIQGYVELASGLGEMTKGAAKDAAAELVSLTNGDLSPKKVTKQASKLADDLIAAANTNRKNLVSLVRSEVDKAVGRLDVSSLQQELANVSDTVHALRSQVEDLAAGLSGRSSAAASGVATPVAKVADVAGGALTDTVAAAAPSPSTPRRPARSALKKTATSTSAAKKASTTKAAATKAPTKKASTTKAAAKKAPAKKASTTKAAAKKAPAKKASTTKAAAKKAPAKKASTTKTAAKKAPAKKASTTSAGESA